MHACLPACCSCQHTARVFVPFSGAFLSWALYACCVSVPPLSLPHPPLQGSQSEGGDGQPVSRHRKEPRSGSTGGAAAEDLAGAGGLTSSMSFAREVSWTCACVYGVCRGCWFHVAVGHLIGGSEGRPTGFQGGVKPRPRHKGTERLSRLDRNFA